MIETIVKSLITVTMIICLWIGGFLAGMEVEESNYQKQALQYQCARYNPTNGEFEWVKKMEK